MTAKPYPIKKDARADRIYFKLNPSVDLTGKSLLWTMTNRSTNIVKIDRATAQVAVGTHIIDGVPYVALTAVDSWGYYDWAAGDLDVPGNYGGEVWIVYPGPIYSKWPSEGFIPIIIGEDAP